MIKRLCVLTGIVSVLAVVNAPCLGEEPPYSVLHRLEQRAVRIAAAPSPTTGVPLPQREPMKAAVLFEKAQDSLVVEEIAYLWAERAYAFAYALRAKESGGRRAAVVILPGRLGHYTRPAYNDLVRDLVRRGCLVLFVGDPHIGKRNTAEAGLYAAASATGISAGRIQLFDGLRALDYLLTRADVDPARIGLIGFERGADAAMLAAMAERRFQFVVPIAPQSAPPDPAADPALSGRFRLVPKWGPGVAPAREVAAWIEDRVAKLPSSSAGPLPCGKPEDPDFSMLRFVQRRIAQQAKSPSSSTTDPAAWKAHREELVRWLGQACRPEEQRPGPVKVVAQAKQNGLLVETLELPWNGDWTCACQRIQRAEPGQVKRPGVILSHDGWQCISSPEIADAARRLAGLGYCVLLPEHASPHPGSLRQVEEAELGRFYALADRAGCSPLALRVIEDLAALRCLTERANVNPAQIVAAGQGIGGLDVCLAALLDSRIAGVVSVDATTVRDWAEKVAPEEDAFSGIMPYLPSMLAKADFDSFYAALAPRPLLLAKLKDGWPKAGFQQVAATASTAYRRSGNENSLVVVSPREVLDEREKRTPEGTLRQLVAVARNLLPAPPAPGVIGGREMLKPRAIIDSASGVVWVVHVQGGVEQEFVDGGYRLTTWSFVNDLGGAQQGRSVTPLVFKKEGDAYRLTAIGKTRVNTGTGVQTFAFEPVAGSDAVGSGCFFGFYTGDPAGKDNAGVVPFSEGPQDRMTILTLDGGLDGQKISLDKLYREQSSYPRTYSIEAISERKPKP